MQVWSNGTIIFSHDQSSVDSISFGRPMHVQANMQSATAVSSLAGSVYVSSLSGTHYADSNGSFSASTLITLCFLDESNGYYTYNQNGHPVSDYNKMVAFTYSISGSDIIINMAENEKYGKLIGKNAIVVANWSSNGKPATFLNYNR